MVSDYQIPCYKVVDMCIPISHSIDIQANFIVYVIDQDPAKYLRVKADSGAVLLTAKFRITASATTGG